MDLYEKNGNILYILNVLKKYSDEEHPLKTTQIQRKIKEIYDANIDTRTIRRNINLLKYKFGYDISTRQENGKGYYINRNPDTDFEPGEIRAIIDNFSYANYIVPSISENIIKKCKNLQNVYENKKLRNYNIFANDTKTDNMEVIKNIEDISNAIQENKKISFEYWKYSLDKKLSKVVVSKPTVSPYAIVYKKQEFYLIAVKDGEEIFYHYRLDRMKNVKVLNAIITDKRTKKEIQEFAESSVEMFGGEKEEIEVICHFYLLDPVLDIFGKNIKLEKIDDEHFRMIVKANSVGFAMWVKRNIDLIEVIKPEKLRNEIKEVLNVANQKYN